MMYSNPVPNPTFGHKAMHSCARCRYFDVEGQECGKHDDWEAVFGGDGKRWTMGRCDDFAVRYDAPKDGQCVLQTYLDDTDREIIAAVKEMTANGELACHTSLSEKITTVAPLTVYRHIQKLVTARELYAEEFRRDGKMYVALYAEDRKHPMTRSQADEIIRRLSAIEDRVKAKGESP